MNTVPQGEVINGAMRVFTGRVPNNARIGRPTTSGNVEIAKIQQKQQETDDRLKNLSKSLAETQAMIGQLSNAIQSLVDQGKPAKKDR